MWACSLDDLRKRDHMYLALRKSHDGGPHMLGACLARNLGVHQVVEVKEMGSGWSYPCSFPLRFNSWRWLPFDRLPPVPKRYRNQEAEDAYRDHLAAREVHTTLALIAQLFNADAEHRGG